MEDYSTDSTTDSDDGSQRFIEIKTDGGGAQTQEIDMSSTDEATSVDSDYESDDEDLSFDLVSNRDGSPNLHASFRNASFRSARLGGSESGSFRRQRSLRSRSGGSMHKLPLHAPREAHVVPRSPRGLQLPLHDELPGPTSSSHTTPAASAEVSSSVRALPPPVPSVGGVGSSVATTLAPPSPLNLTLPPHGAAASAAPPSGPSPTGSPRNAASGMAKPPRSPRLATIAVTPAAASPLAQAAVRPQQQQQQQQQQPAAADPEQQQIQQLLLQLQLQKQKNQMQQTQMQQQQAQLQAQQQLQEQEHLQHLQEQKLQQQQQQQQHQDHEQSEQHQQLPLMRQASRSPPPSDGVYYTPPRSSPRPSAAQPQRTRSAAKPAKKDRRGAGGDGSAAAATRPLPVAEVSREVASVMRKAKIEQMRAEIADLDRKLHHKGGGPTKQKRAGSGPRDAAEPESPHGCRCSCHRCHGHSSSRRAGSWRYTAPPSEATTETCSHEAAHAAARRKGRSGGGSRHHAGDAGAAPARRARSAAAAAVPTRDDILAKAAHRRFGLPVPPPQTPGARLRALKAAAAAVEEDEEVEEGYSATEASTAPSLPRGSSLAALVARHSGAGSPLTEKDLEALRRVAAWMHEEDRREAGGGGGRRTRSEPRRAAEEVRTAKKASQKKKKNKKKRRREEEDDDDEEERRRASDVARQRHTAPSRDKDRVAFGESPFANWGERLYLEAMLDREAFGAWAEEERLKEKLKKRREEGLTFTPKISKRARDAPPRLLTTVAAAMRSASAPNPRGGGRRAASAKAKRQPSPSPPSPPPPPAAALPLPPQQQLLPTSQPYPMWGGSVPMWPPAPAWGMAPPPPPPPPHHPMSVYTQPPYLSVPASMGPPLQQQQMPQQMQQQQQQYYSQQQPPQPPLPPPVESTGSGTHDLGSTPYGESEASCQSGDEVSDEEEEETEEEEEADEAEETAEQSSAAATADRLVHPPPSRGGYGVAAAVAAGGGPPVVWPTTRTYPTPVREKARRRYREATTYLHEDHKTKEARRRATEREEAERIRKDSHISSHLAGKERRDAEAKERQRERSALARSRLHEVFERLDERKTGVTSLLMVDRWVADMEEVLGKRQRHGGASALEENLVDFVRVCLAPAMRASAARSFTLETATQAFEAYYAKAGAFHPFLAARKAVPQEKPTYTPVISERSRVLALEKARALAAAEAAGGGGGGGNKAKVVVHDKLAAEAKERRLRQMSNQYHDRIERFASDMAECTFEPSTLEAAIAAEAAKPARKGKGKKKKAAAAGKRGGGDGPSESEEALPTPPTPESPTRSFSHGRRGEEGSMIGSSVARCVFCCGFFCPPTHLQPKKQKRCPPLQPFVGARRGVQLAGGLLARRGRVHLARPQPKHRHRGELRRQHGEG